MGSITQDTPHSLTSPPQPTAFSAARTAAAIGRHSPLGAPQPPRDRCPRYWHGRPLGFGYWRTAAARSPAPGCPISQHGEHSRPAPFSAYRLPCWRSRSRPCGQRSTPAPPASPSHEDGQSATAFLSTLHTTGSGGKLLRRDMLLGNMAAEVRVKPHVSRFCSGTRFALSHSRNASPSTCHRSG